MGLLRWILASCVVVAPGSAVAAVSLSFDGSGHKVIEITPASNSGLERLYVVYDASELHSMTLEGASTDLTVSRYSNLGGGYAEPVSFTWDGQNAVIANPVGDMGYIFTQNGRNTCVWLVDYSKSPFNPQAVIAATTQDCDNTHIDITGQGEPIYYYSIDGRRIELNRGIEAKYTMAVWNESSSEYDYELQTKELSHAGTITLMPPLNHSTDISVSGDRFLKEWGMEKHVASTTLYPNGLEVHTTAVQTNLPEESEDGSNIIPGNGAEGDLGGSAPADLKFTAYATEAVIHHEWQIAADPEFGIPEYRFNESEIEYSFTEEGTYYVRYIGSNADGSCSVYGDTYTVSIGSSELRIPNAFTPNGDGVNDVWKVGYRSLLSFKCWIFDRYGNEIYHFDNPAGGWDGKRNGKLVKPGVYFYVIEAKGSDGKKYKKGGDINILEYKRFGNSGGDVTQ